MSEAYVCHCLKLIRRTDMQGSKQIRSGLCLKGQAQALGRLTVQSGTSVLLLYSSSVKGHIHSGQLAGCMRLLGAGTVHLLLDKLQGVLLGDHVHARQPVHVGDAVHLVRLVDELRTHRPE